MEQPLNIAMIQGEIPQDFVTLPLASDAGRSGIGRALDQPSRHIFNLDEVLKYLVPILLELSRRGEPIIYDTGVRPATHGTNVGGT